MIRRALLPVLGTSLTLLALGVTAGDNRHRNRSARSRSCVPTQEVPSVSSGRARPLQGDDRSRESDDFL